MIAGTFDFIIEEGAVFDETIVWYDSDGALVDLTGYSAEMEIRKNWNDSTALATLTSASGITLGGVAGTIRLRMTSAVTRALDFDRAVYDLELSPSGAADMNASTDCIRLLEGVVVLDREVTR